MIKKYITYLVTITLLTTSCITRDLWKEETFTQDHVRQFLIVKDANQVIFIGQKYHYIFNNRPDLIKVLLWNGRSKLRVSINDFKIEKSNKINVKVNLWASKQKGNKNKKELLSQKEINFLKKFGFSTKGQNSSFKKTLNLSGLIYKTNQHINMAFSEDKKLHLQRSYPIKIKHSNLKSSSIKLALTPLAVIGDSIAISSYAILAAGVTGMAVLALPIIIVESLKSKTSNKIIK